MKNLINKIKEGGKKVIKATAPVAAGVIMSTSNVDAQEANSNVYSYENHNEGASIQKDQIRVEGQELEAKMLYGKGMYFQNVPFEVEDFPRKEKDIDSEDLANTFGDRLNLYTIYRHDAQIDLDAYTKGFLEITSDTPYQWVRAKDNEGNDLNIVPLSFKIDPRTGRPEAYGTILCDQQLNEANGMTGEEPSYIAKENLEGILDNFVNKVNTLTLNRNINGELMETGFYFFKSGSGIQMVPIVEDYTRLRLLPSTKNKNGMTLRSRDVAIVSPLGVYELAPVDEKVIIEDVPSSALQLTSEGAFHDESLNNNEEKKQEAIKKERGKGNAYINFGANANYEIIEGEPLTYWDANLGFQKGWFGMNFNVGHSTDEILQDYDSESNPENGNYFHFTETNKKIWNVGTQAELHFLNNRFVSPYIGAGINAWTYVPETTSELKDSQDNQLKPIAVSNSPREFDFSWKANAGVDFGKGIIKGGPQITYDSRLKTHIVGGRLSLGRGNKK